MTANDFFFLAVDIETTGRNPRIHPMIAFGAAVVSVNTQCVVENGIFRAIMPFDVNVPSDQSDQSYPNETGPGPETGPNGTGPNGTGQTVWEQRCLDEFWTKPDTEGDDSTPLMRLQSCAVRYGTMSEYEATKSFVAWAETMFLRYGSRLIVITDTAAYDTTWLNNALGEHAPSIGNLLYLSGSYRPVRDVSSFHFGVGRKTPAQGFFGSNNSALKALKCEEFPEHVTNTPHDHDPAHDAEYIAKTAAFIAYKLDTQ